MRAKGQLNERQADLLARIVSDEVSVTSRDSTLALTVYALRRRGLVETVLSDGGWTAVPTDSGRYYAAHGTYRAPADVPERSRSTRSRANTSAGRRILNAAEIIARIEAAGGTLTIPNPDPTTRRWWRRSIQAAIRSGSPFHYTGRMDGDLIVVMGKADPADVRRRLAAAKPKVAGFSTSRVDHPLVAELREAIVRQSEQEIAFADAASCLPRVSPGSAVQALRTLNALFGAAEERGYCVRPVERPKARQLARYRVILGAMDYPVAVVEHGGVLVLKLEDVHVGRTLWHDGRRTRLEHKVGDVLDNLEERVREADERRRERALVDEELARLHDAEIMEQRAAYERHWVAGFLGRQVADWRLADEIRALCKHLQHSGSEAATKTGGAGWIAWALEQADRIDPTIRPMAVPLIPDPTPADLARVAEMAMRTITEA